jgi:hypothetical protein
MSDQVPDAPVPSAPEPARPPELDEIVRALRGLRFGEVRVVVHDGILVHLERTERRRLQQR